MNFPKAVPDSGGIPQAVADQVLIAPFNDLDAVASLLDEHADIAAILVEPIAKRGVSWRFSEKRGAIGGPFRPA